MQRWELIRRLLAGARPGQSFNPGLIARKYLEESEAAGAQELPSLAELSAAAEQFSEELEQAGLIQESGSKPRVGIAVLGSKATTQFGSELLQVLNGSNVVKMFESMQAEIEPGEIRRLLHQLNS